MRRGFSAARVWVAVSRQPGGCTARHMNASGCQRPKFLEAVIADCIKANFSGKPLRRCCSQRSYDRITDCQRTNPSRGSTTSVRAVGGCGVGFLVG